MTGVHSSIQPDVARAPGAKRGFALLPGRWVKEHSFAGLSRFRRHERDYERLPEILMGLHFVACARLMLDKATSILTEGI